MRTDPDLEKEALSYPMWASLGPPSPLSAFIMWALGVLWEWAVLWGGLQGPGVQQAAGVVLALISSYCREELSLRIGNASEKTQAFFGILPLPWAQSSGLLCGLAGARPLWALVPSLWAWPPREVVVIAQPAASSWP